ncbi:hypothetical protein ACWDE9_41625 [Streptomyces olivaceoviridis]
MRLCKRAPAFTFVATVAFSALGPQAMAAPMPWETGKTPTAVHHGISPARESATVTVRCAPPCYQ